MDMTPKRRLDRLERLAKVFIRAGRRTRTELREDINILIDMQNQNEDRFNVRFQRIEELFAKNEERFAKNEERFAKNEERFAKNEERFAKNEERFAKNEERFARIEQAIERLIASQMRTDEKLQGLIDTLRRTDLGGSFA